MYYSLSYKSKQFFWLTLKLGIVIGCVLFCYHKLFYNNQLEFSLFLQQLEYHDIFLLKNIVLLLALTFLNWFFEILKWKSLVATTQRSTLTTAAIQSLASLTVSLITPNRIGEYGAKAIYFDNTKRKYILGLNVIGNTYQMVVTIAFGTLGIGYLLWRQHLIINIESLLNKVLILSTGILLLVGIIVYSLRRNTWTQKVRDFIGTIPIATHKKIILLSLARYFVFAHQFYLLLNLFHLDISYTAAITAISTTYLIASIIPMLSILDVVIKGTVAVWTFSLLDVSPLPVLCSTTIMWFLNFVLPASIGSYFVLTFQPKYNT